MKIKISFENIGEVIVKLVREWNPKTIEKLIKILPVTSIANRWGDEIYFDIGIEIEEENSKIDMEIGEVAIWPPGKALCLFFGPTPISSSNKPKAYSPVNPIGMIESGIEILNKVNSGVKVKVELIS